MVLSVVVIQTSALSIKKLKTTHTVQPLTNKHGESFISMQNTITMIRDELNGRLEILLGNTVANDIWCQATQEAVSRTIEYNVSIGSVEQQTLFYEALIDNILTHYEVQRE